MTRGSGSLFRRIEFSLSRTKVRCFAGVLVGRRERLAGPLARTGMGPTRRTENGRADAELSLLLLVRLICGTPTVGLGAG